VCTGTDLRFIRIISGAALRWEIRGHVRRETGKE
jgi:hypothetical protein